MDQDSLKRLKRNNKIISRLMAENERILRKAGYHPPVHDFPIEKEERICIPSNYIRTADRFGEKYHLNEIVVSKNTRRNVAYALQLSDFYNYLINRFFIWGSIEIMLYKQAFVNVISIIEALILECANNINAYCKNCNEIGKCKSNICREERENMKSALKKLFDLGIVNLSDEDYSLLIKYYDYRNRIHIRLNDQNEFLDNKFNCSLYNCAIVLLRKIDEQIVHNGVNYYETCMGFVDKNKQDLLG